MRTIGRMVAGEYRHPFEAFGDPLLLETTVVVLLVSIVVNLVLQVSELIGPGELGRFVMGRYHHPRTGWWRRSGMDERAARAAVRGSRAPRLATRAGPGAGPAVRSGCFYFAAAYGLQVSRLLDRTTFQRLPSIWPHK